MKEIDHPIAYFSTELLPRETKNSTIEKYCLATKLGMQAFQIYLIGQAFKIETDHWSFNRMEDSNPRLNTMESLSSRAMNLLSATNLENEMPMLMPHPNREPLSSLNRFNTREGERTSGYYCFGGFTCTMVYGIWVCACRLLFVLTNSVCKFVMCWVLIVLTCIKMTIKVVLFWCVSLLILSSSEMCWTNDFWIFHTRFGHLNGHCNLFYVLAFGYVLLKDVFPFESVEAMLTEVLDALYEHPGCRRVGSSPYPHVSSLEIWKRLSVHLSRALLNQHITIPTSQPYMLRANLFCCSTLSSWEKGQWLL